MIKSILTKIRTHFNKFVRQDGGNVAIIFSLVVVPVLLFAGGAVDFSRAKTARNTLQYVADLAALAGASILGATNEERITAARKMFDTNWTESLGDAAAEISVDEEGVVHVLANGSTPTTTLTLMHLDRLDFTVRAGAKTYYGNDTICLLALNKHAPDSMHLQGGNRVIGRNCYMWVNSDHQEEAAYATGNSIVHAKATCVGGEVEGKDHFSPQPTLRCPYIKDPYLETLEAPDTDGCDYHERKLKKGSHIIHPGVYCGGLELKPHANVIFRPGVYVIKGGKLNIQAGSNAIGDEVAFYFTGEDATLQLLGGADVAFTAPKEDHELAGFIFVQDRESSIGETTKIQGGGYVFIDGVVYMPTQIIEVGGNGDFNQHGRMYGMIADQFQFKGNGEFKLDVDFEAAGLPDILPKVPGGGKVVF